MAHSFDIYEKFDIRNIQSTDYSQEKTTEFDTSFDISRAVADIKKIVRIVFTEGAVRYIYKDVKNDNTYQVKILSEEAAKKLFQKIYLRGFPKIKVGGAMKPQNIWSVLNMSPAAFTVPRFNFYCPDEDCFNLFSGYHIQTLPQEEYNEKLIEKHLYHWKHIICADDEAAYNYVLNWVANILQNPLAQNRTVLGLIAEQGVGKNEFFCCPIQNILTNDYSYETGNANNIFGEFNSPIAHKKLVILNEAKSSDSKSSQCIDYDTFKDVITSKTITINAKGEQQYVIDNVMNMIITSNNNMPFRIQDNDRRMVFLDVSNQFAEIADTEENRNNPEIQQKIEARTKYFHDLDVERKNPLFLRTLFTFLMNRDISKFDPDLRPLTKKKENMIVDSRNPMEIFVEENITNIADCAWESKLAYSAYREFCKANGYVCVKNIQGFIGALRNLGITSDRKTINGQRITVLEMSEEAKQRFAKELKELEEPVNINSLDRFETLLTKMKTLQGDDSTKLSALLKIIDELKPLY